jgi:peptidoglycan/LPS O-acetylase OafA/YrhL
VSGYAVARAARIYSVVLPCLAIGWLLDAAGPHLGPEIYAATPHFDGPAGPAELLSSLLFLDHLWFRAAQPGSNLPFWSLCFEAWYYLAFGLLVFAPRPWNWFGAAAAMVLAGPKIALLFPLWLLGAACQRLCAAGGVSRATGWILLLAPCAVLAVWDPRIRGCYPYDPLDRDMACLLDLHADYIVGVLVAAQLLGVHAIAPLLWRWLRPLAAPVAWLAGASFTLYLLHYPLIHFLAAASPWPVDHWATRLMVFILTPLLVLLVAQASERRRHAWRRATIALLGLRSRTT